jgi:hypothetical protein
LGPGRGAGEVGVVCVGREEECINDIDELAEAFNKGSVNRYVRCAVL